MDGPTRVISDPEVADAFPMDTAFETLRHPVARLRSWQASLSTPERLVLLATALYAILMSALTVAKIGSLRTYAWDLGTFSQALYTTAFQGRFFYFTADLPNNPAGSLFGAHFAPFLAVLVPLYRILPSPATLVVVQTLAIAAGAPLVFRIARLRLKDERVAAVLAVAYLLNPFVEGVNWFDFHPEAFMMVFLLAMIWAWEERRWLRFAIFTALTLSTLEMAGVLVATVGLFWAADLLLAKRSLRDVWGVREFRVSVLLIVVGAAWVFLGLQAIALVNPANALLSGGTGSWSVLGADSLLGVPAAALANPGNLVAALAYDGLLKLWYLILLFVPLLLWPLRRPLALLLVAPWLVAALTSNFLAYYVVGTQYGAFVAPMVFYGAVLGLERHRARHPAAPRPQGLGASRIVSEALIPSGPLPMAAFAVAFAILACPASPAALGVYGMGGFPVYTAHDAVVQEIAALVPPGASILTQNNLFPFFADRADAYVIPHSTFFGPGDSFNRTLHAYVNESQYVFVDAGTSMTEALVVLQALGPTSGFGVVAAADGALLLERGYVGTPGLFQRFNGTYGAWNLALVNGTAVVDTGALDGVAMASLPGHVGTFWTGPQVILGPGTYTLTFRVRLNPAVAGTVLRVEVRLRPGFISVLPESVSALGSGVRLTTGLRSCENTVIVQNLTGADFPNPVDYATFSIPLTANLFGAYNFTGVLPGTSSVVSLDRITAIQVTALPYVQTATCGA